MALAVVAGFGAYLGSLGLRHHVQLPKPRGCTVQAQGRVSLNPEQMANAATIAAIGVQRKMPEKAVVVALATALQESKLENLAGGDRDSVGLFQQRPSQGWGSPEQLVEPRFAAARFYGSLKKVRGWEKMSVTQAAQAVQRSAYPEAYGKWIDESEVLARALLGNATGAVACTVARKPALRGSAAATSLSTDLTLDWGKLNVTATSELTGFTVPAADAQAGWRYAHWLVSHADGQGVKRVRFGDLEWTADDGDWVQISDGAPSVGRVVAEVFADV